MTIHTIGAILFTIGIAMGFGAIHAFADEVRANGFATALSCFARSRKRLRPVGLQSTFAQSSHETINDGSDCFHGEGV